MFVLERENVCYNVIVVLELEFGDSDGLLASPHHHLAKLDEKSPPADCI